MPFALSIGVDMGSFWASNPHTLSLIAQGYWESVKRQIENDNAMAYLQGAYFREALLSTVGNILSDKHSQKYSYPDKPYDLDLDGHKGERERDKQIELFAGQLTTAMNNFNLAKTKGK